MLGFESLNVKVVKCLIVESCCLCIVVEHPIIEQYQQHLDLFLLLLFFDLTCCRYAGMIVATGEGPSNKNHLCRDVHLRAEEGFAVMTMQRTLVLATLHPQNRAVKNVGRVDLMRVVTTSQQKVSQERKAHVLLVMMPFVHGRSFRSGIRAKPQTHVPTPRRFFQDCTKEKIYLYWYTVFWHTIVSTYRKCTIEGKMNTSSVFESTLDTYAPQVDLVSNSFSYHPPSAEDMPLHNYITELLNKEYVYAKDQDGIDPGSPAMKARLRGALLFWANLVHTIGCVGRMPCATQVFDETTTSLQDALTNVVAPANQNNPGPDPRPLPSFGCLLGNPNQIQLFAMYISDNLVNRWRPLIRPAYKTKDAVHKFFTTTNLSVLLAAQVLATKKTYCACRLDTFITKLWNEMTKCKIPLWVKRYVLWWLRLWVR